MALFTGKKKMILHCFNPSHDDALASGRADYCPSRLVRSMEEQLALLPVWWAAGGDAVLAGNEAETLVFYGRHRALLPSVQFLSATPLSGVTAVEPWGWDARLAHRLALGGCPSHILPSPVSVDRVRALSSRKTAVGVLKRLRGLLGEEGFTGQSFWVETPAALSALLQHFPKLVLKAPWSCSGRGVFALTAGDGKAWSRALSVMRKQGAVEAEPFYGKVADFAMEFTADGRGGVAFEGLSLFCADGASYVGNAVMTDGRMAVRLGQQVPRESLQRVRDALLVALSEQVAPFYQGPLGVDMMVCRHPAGSGRCVLHPCIEINLRRTMGRVAIDLRRLLAPGAEGLVRLCVERSADALSQKMDRLMAQNPLVMEENRIRSGAFMLTPISGSTSACALLQVWPRPIEGMW